ncbi:fibronectin type III domain-containing protein [Oceanobacillus oncorhynchi]|uniref:fibronectin type III domain-containing protein n=1 Tax=Oceanobacillus oncorhynchi TaxID=545501 RepID=UPI0034D4C638
MAKTYNVYQNGERIASNIETTSYTVTGLSPETEYSFSITAENEFGESGHSNEATVTTDGSEPEDPEDLQVVGQSDTTADLEW